jgi:hypothetical protein
MEEKEEEGGEGGGRGEIMTIIFKTFGTWFRIYSIEEDAKIQNKDRENHPMK